MFVVPNWFIGYDALTEAIFAVVTLLVSLLAFKIFKLTKSNNSKLLGFGFLFIAFSYAILAIFNAGNCFNLHESFCEITKWDPVMWYYVQLYIHLILYLLGLVTLVYMTFKTKSPKLYSLLILISALPFMFSLNFPHVYFVLSSVLLAYIFAFYLGNFFKNPNLHTALIMVAFTFLFIADLTYIFTMKSAMSYVIYHFIELVAYILILFNLVTIIKK
ncbi:hypothetical protein H6503_01165 [Candidatus Woesearchaeota archaeon]|nr:hypothetical protein [Candidatus Woesearchaeota archaeon]